MIPGPSIRVGAWTITTTYLVAVGLAAVFAVGLATAPNVSDEVRPFSIAFVLAFVAAVPIHEFGHVVVVRQLGHRVVHVRVGLYSGVSWSTGAAVLSVRDVLLVSAAGPAANGFVAIGCLLLVMVANGATALLAGIAAAMAVASVLDLVPTTGRHAVADGSDEVRMSDGATILHAWRQRVR